MAGEQKQQLQLWFFKSFQREVEADISSFKHHAEVLSGNFQADSEFSRRRMKELIRTSSKLQARPPYR
jgi:hypothetical protein